MTGGARGVRRPASFGEVRDSSTDPSGSDTSGEPAGSRRPPRALIFAVTVTGIMANTLVAPAIPDILDGLGVDQSRAGLLLAAATLPGVVVAPLIGLLADRYGRREVLIPCLVAFGLFGGLSGLAPTFGLVLAARLAQGVGSAGLINLAVVLIADHWHGPDRARVIGQNSAVLTVALAVLPSLGGVLTDGAGWRVAFVPFWLGLVTAVVVATIMPRGTRSAVRIGDQARQALTHLRSTRVLAAIGSGTVLFTLIFGLMLTVLPLYLAEDFGLSASARGLILGIPALSATAGALALGRLTGHFGTRRIVLAGSAVLAGAFTIVAGAPVLAAVILGTLVYGFGEGVTIPSLQAIVAGAAPATSRGTVVAVWVGGVRVGQTAGPVLAGLAFTRLGASGTFLAGAALALALLVAQVVSGHPDVVDT